MKISGVRFLYLAPTKNMNNYKKIKSVNRDEHRIIMEEYLGRPLEPGEIVHHVDDDRSNNDIENLELCLLSVHTSYHHKGTEKPSLRGIRCKHGTRTRYEKWGCRCDLCSEAKRSHNLQRYNKGNCRASM